MFPIVDCNLFVDFLAIYRDLYITFVYFIILLYSNSNSQSILKKIHIIYNAFHLLYVYLA